MSNGNTAKSQRASGPMSILQPRRWHERGSADHGWLKTFHTFSFANYYDARFEDFGPLRVLNEDRVAPKTGFPTHAHNNAEIFSYIISGQLTHRDSMGNVEVLKRGEVQFTSAGSGIRHSEYNDHANEEVHFLQIWYTPDERNLTPKYYSTPHIDDVEKRNRFLTLIKPACTFSAQELSQIGLLPAGRAIPAHCSLSTSVSLLSAGASVKYAIGSQTESKAGSERWIYIHLAMTSGWKEPRLHAQHIRKYVVPNQPHQTRLEHAAQFLRGVYARTASWASYPAPSNRSYRPTRKALSSRAKRPRVTLTFAQSIDGYIAGEGKEQVALSSSESFVMTHALRTMHDGILVGVGTLINDNPQLNARLLSPLQTDQTISVQDLPRPIILDTHLRTPLDRKILTNYSAGTGAKPLIVTSSVATSSAPNDEGAARKEALQSAGADVLEVGTRDGKLDWVQVLSGLKDAGVEHLMVEGGADVISSLLAAHEETTSDARSSDSASTRALGDVEGLIDTIIVTISRTRLGKGVSYDAPAWLSRVLSPMKPLSRKGKTRCATALPLQTLAPEPFGKDFVMVWGGAALDAEEGASSQATVQIALGSYDQQRDEEQEVRLEEGDGVFIRGARSGQELFVRNLVAKDAEVVLFDVEPAR